MKGAQYYLRGLGVVIGWLIDWQSVPGVLTTLFPRSLFPPLERGWGFDKNSKLMKKNAKKIYYKAGCSNLRKPEKS